jgi:hypothetical protein
LKQRGPYGFNSWRESCSCADRCSLSGYAPPRSSCQSAQHSVAPDSLRDVLQRLCWLGDQTTHHACRSEVRCYGIWTASVGLEAPRAIGGTAHRGSATCTARAATNAEQVPTLLVLWVSEANCRSTLDPSGRPAFSGEPPRHIRHHFDEQRARSETTKRLAPPLPS